MATVTSLTFRIRSTWNGDGMRDARRSLTTTASSAARAGSQFDGAALAMNGLITAAVGVAPAIMPIGAAAASAAGAFTAMTVSAGSALGIYGAAVGGAVSRTLSLASAGKKLDPTQKVFISNVDRMKGAWDKFIAGTQDKTLLVANDVVSGLAVGIGKLAPVVNAVHPIIKRVSQAFQNWTMGDGLDRFIQTIITFGVPALRSLMNAGRDVLAFLGDGFRAFAPLGTGMAQSLEKGAAALAKWSAGGGFQRFIQRVKNDAPMVSDFFRALGAALKTLGQTMVQLGPLGLGLAGTLLKIIGAMPPEVLANLVRLWLLWRAAMMGFMAIKALIAIFMAIKTAVLALRAAWMLLNIAFNMSGIGLIITLAAALIAGIVYLATQTNFFQTVWRVAWNAIKVAFEATVNWLTNAWRTFTAFLSTAWNVGFAVLRAVWTTAWNAVRTVFMAVWNGIRLYITLWWTVVTTVFRTAISIITTVWRTAWNVVRTVFTAIFNGIRTYVTAWWTVVRTIFTTWLTIVQTVWRVAWNVLRTVFTAIFNAIRAYVTAWWTVVRTLFTTGLNLIRTLWTAVWNAVRTVVIAVWNAIRTAATAFWNALRSVFRAGWTALRNGWNAVWTAIRDFVLNLWTNIRQRAQAFWDLVRQIFRASWTALRNGWNNVWDAIRDFVLNLWTNIRQRAQAFWDLVRQIFRASWTALRNGWNNVWDAIRDFVLRLWTNIRQRAQAFWDLVRQIFRASWTALRNGWNNVWDSIRDFVLRLWTNIRQRAQAFWDLVRQIFRASWTALKNGWQNVWNGIRDFVVDLWRNIRTRAEGFLDTLKNRFKAGWESIRDTARSVWNSIGNVIESAINKVIGIVNKLIDGFNNVAKFLKIKVKIDGIGEVNFSEGGMVPGFAKGGVMNLRGGGVTPGFSPGRDTVDAKLSPGEGVLTPEAVRGLGGPGFVHSANRSFAGHRGAGRGAGALPPMGDGSHAHGFAQGGMVPGGPTQNFAMGGITLAALARAGLAGTPITQPEYNTGVAASAGTHDGGGVIDLPPNYGVLNKLLSTGQWAAWMRTPAQGFSPHIHAIYMGHPDIAPAARAQVGSFLAGGTGLGSGGGGGGGGGNPFAALLGNLGSILRNVAMGKDPQDGVDDGGGGVGGFIKGMLGNIANMATGGLFDMGKMLLGSVTSKMLDTAFDWIKFDGIPGGKVGEIAVGAGKMLLKGAKDFIFGKASEAKEAGMDLNSMGGAGVGGDVSMYRPLAAQALMRAGIPQGQLGAFMALMRSESGGNPMAQNNWDSNAAKGQASRGLMQVIPSTFAAYRDKTLSNNIFDPLANMTAAARYIRARYGGNVPGSPYAMGTNNASRGWHLVGENGPEMRYFRGGEQVQNARNTTRALERVSGSDGVVFEKGAFTIDARGATSEAVRDMENNLIPKLRLAVQAGVGKRG